MPTNITPTHPRPWSVIDDEHLHMYRRLVELCREIVDGFDPEHDRYHLELDSATGGCKIEVGEMRDLLEKLGG